MTRLLPALAALALAGCGGGDPAPPAASFAGDVDAVAVSNLVEEFNEKKLDPKAFAGFFAPGAVPKDAKGYRGLDLGPAEKPAVTGATATCKVNAARGAKEPAVVEWAFEKVGDKWKIKSAPLPAGK